METVWPSNLPAHCHSFALEQQHSITESEATVEKAKQHAAKHYNNTAYILPDIKVGSNVVLQDQGQTYEIHMA